MKLKNRALLWGSLYLQGFHPRDLVIGGVIFIASAALLLCAPCFDFGSETFKWICVSYAFVISLMLGKAIANLICTPNAVTALIAAGSFLFFFSDLMLVFAWFGGFPGWTNNACMAAYYPALCTLAFSMYCKILCEV